MFQGLVRELCPPVKQERGRLICYSLIARRPSHCGSPGCVMLLRVVMKARHRSRWDISITGLVWLLMAATAVMLSDLMWMVFPLK